MATIRAFGLTDPGLARPHNEDSFFVDASSSVYVVADGMGGHSHGEVASKIAVDTISDLLGGPNPVLGDVASSDGSALLPHSLRLKEAIERAHDAMIDAIRGNLSLQGMGTTVAGFMVEGDVASVAHVGDSRVYRRREGVFELLTTDHTWVNEQVMAGHLSEDQARTHPLRNVVTRALGGETEVLVDVRELEILAGDVFVVCSDGLTAMLEDEDIERRLQSEDSLEQICQQLVDDANARGGVDNITVIVVSMGPDEAA
ncbi:MAG: Stp1/IreP family PP2C-type Ser/Thr phosphatase [Acidobacteriota bacterium]|nr:Stp1/IreP family PP2C-type Ser/Thr phosphatase [Acidobacteriota bacterium]